MASFLLGFLVIFATSWMVQASDPDILSDFIVPPNVSAPDGTRSNSLPWMARAFQWRCCSTLLVELIPLTRIHVLQNSWFVLEGSLQVGFVDTTNKLFTQTLQTGDIFVFPKGLVQYQYNADPKELAIAVSAFGSANAGTASLPTTLFASGVDDTVLAKSFKTDVVTIQKLKAGLAPKA